MDHLPRFVIIQYTFAEHRSLLLNRLGERRPVLPLAPFCQPGEIGTWHSIPIACYSGPVSETTLVPILEQPSVQIVFSLGLAGALTPHLQRGGLVCPSASVRGDGLTDYWANPMLPAVANFPTVLALSESARRLGQSLTHGIFYTTPTLYREAALIQPWAELGVIAIQMELAQHFLLAHLHSKQAAGLYVISDSPLAGDAIWRSGIELDQALADSYGRAVEILLDAICMLSEM